MSKKPPLLLVRKVKPGLLATVDPVSDEYLETVPVGKEAHVQIWLPRNPKFHRFAMAYLNHVFQNQDHFDTFERLIRWIMAKTGNCEMYFGPKGEVYQIRDSLAFSAMDEVHFRRFMKRAEFWISEELIIGMDLEEFDREVLRTVSQYEAEATTAA